MQETVNVVSQYYTDFVNLPIGYQVATGVAALVVISALRNIWKITLPVRASVAAVLRSTAFIVHPRKRKVKEVQVEVEKVVTVAAKAAPKWDTSTKKAYSKTAKHFASENNVSDLTDEQLKIIVEVGAIYGYDESGYEAYYAINEVKKRKLEKKAREISQYIANPCTQYGDKAEVDEFTRRQNLTENIA